MHYAPADHSPGATTSGQAPGTQVAGLMGPAQIFWDTSDDFLIVTDGEGLLCAANPAWCHALGWGDVPPPDLRMPDLIHDHDLPGALEVLREWQPSSPCEPVELRMRTTSGAYLRVAWSGVSHGGLWYLTGRDVTAARRAEESAKEAAGFWQATLDSLEHQVAILDDLGRILAVNQAWRDFGQSAGRGRQSDAGTSYLEACDQAGDEPGGRQAADGIRSLLAGAPGPVVFDYPLGDQWFIFKATAFVGPGSARVVVTHADVTANRRLAQEARAQASVLDKLEVSVVAADKDLLVTQWSGGSERLYGWSREEVLGRNLVELIGPHPVAMTGEGDTVTEGRFEVSRKDGSRFVGDLRWAELQDAHGDPAGILGVGVDFSAMDRAEKDAGNARSHLEAVTDSMSEGLFALGHDGSVTVMNRAAELALGWSLDEIRGQRLHDITTHRTSEGHFHASETCPLGGAGDRAAIVHVDDDVFMRRDGVALPVSYTVTPLKTPEGDDGWVMVFRDATQVHSERARLREELNAVVWIQRIQAALDEDRLLLYAQPIVDLSTMSGTQHELLLRVVEKDGSISPPGDYIAFAEEFGLIEDIDRWVIRQAIDLAAAGHSVEVNVSALSLGNRELLRDIEQWLLLAGADPSLLVFEITETAVIADEQAGREFVAQIHALGCKVALDDFGTGYSGFAYLKTMPVDFLKIDIEFVQDLLHNDGSQHVVEAVVQLARGFGLKTVAEGVEDVETLELLRALGVDYVQGYHLGRPAPIHDLPISTTAEEQT